MSAWNFSVEIVPPVKGNGTRKLYESLEKILPYSPTRLNITAHRTFRFTEENGIRRRQIDDLRPGTSSLAAAVQQRYGITVVPHLVGSGYTKDEMELLLLDMTYLGITSVLALRGDAAEENSRALGRQDYPHATDLIAQIKDFNQGRLLNGTPNHVVEPLQFDVAGYPERHTESPSWESEMQHLKLKTDMGASHILTQLFFDTNAYLAWTERCAQYDIRTPRIAGLKPARSLKMLKMFGQWGVGMPDGLARKMEDAATPTAEREAGIAWCVVQCKALIDNGVTHLHFYAGDEMDDTLEVLDRLR